jgi:hypothetical protein
MRCNHLPSPGLCKVFELGIDDANGVDWGAWGIFTRAKARYLQDKAFTRV